MFCYQCEQTVGGTGCTKVGVCGKEGTVSDMQDLLIETAKNVSAYGVELRKKGMKNADADHFILEALFTAVTNVNFDNERLQGIIKKGLVIRDTLKEKYVSEFGKNISNELVITDTSLESLINLAKNYSLENDIRIMGDVNAGIKHTLLYGLKGMAAYLDHALVLGYEDDSLYDFFYEAMNFLNRTDQSTDELLTMALKAGEVNLKVMELLDKANTSSYGHPEPTKVRITPKKGKAILVSGHDMKDLEEILKQSEGKGINVYTHGEMLPTNAYPELKKFSHFAGNYGSAWQNQQKEFDEFPGAILMTTNCIQKPKITYNGRIFTSGLVAFPGVKHISDRDFSSVIESALSAPGFAKDGEEKYITVGFGRNAVLSAAGKIVELVKNGKIKRFFLIGGCDGAKAGRNYYTDFAQRVPADCVIMTLACGKYRFNKLEFGDIEGIPRLLDIGQCNDAYSAIQIAVALADVFKTDVNSLPLSFILSWYEQKAVCILLTLLSLGIKNIRLGPTLPAFIKPAALAVLVEKFDIKPITTVEEDMKAIMG